jgi:hypothetical protein
MWLRAVRLTSPQWRAQICTVKANRKQSILQWCPRDCPQVPSCDSGAHFQHLEEMLLQGKWSDYWVHIPGSGPGTEPQTSNSTSNHYPLLPLKSLVLTKYLGNPFFTIMLFVFVFVFWKGILRNINKPGILELKENEKLRTTTTTTTKMSLPWFQSIWKIKLGIQTPKEAHTTETWFPYQIEGHSCSSNLFLFLFNGTLGTPDS